jgi:hypothetical protein
VTNIFVDESISDDLKRRRLYSGDLFVYSNIESVREFCNFTRKLIEEAFHPLTPEKAQYELPVEKYAEILAKLKPHFIHHPQAKEYIKQILLESGCDLDKVYFDVPRLRTSTSDGYLTTGIAYAFHPHRDTWYSAPMSQINWWFPIYEFTDKNGLAFHPGYWNKPVKNSSCTYNYYEWNKIRGDAAKFIKKDTRQQPKSEELISKDDIRVVTTVGGIIQFSAAHLHSSVNNISGRTRFSIDFRTVHIDDLINKTEALNVDSECTGTTLRDFIRAKDFSRLPEDVVALHDSGEITNGAILLYKPNNK